MHWNKKRNVLFKIHNLSKIEQIMKFVLHDGGTAAGEQWSELAGMKRVSERDRERAREKVTVFWAIV